MSLLPQTIPPQTEPWGRADKDGVVIVDPNWWLFLFNIGKQVLSAPATPIPIPPATSILLVEAEDIAEVDALQAPRQIANARILEALDTESPGADIAGLPLLIANAQLLQPEQDVVLTQQAINNAQLLQPDPDVTPSLGDMAGAFLLATDQPLPDPTPQAQPAITVTVGTSPFTYTAPANGVVSVTAGTVSLISIIRQAVTVATGLTAGLVPVSRGDGTQITYTGLPTVVFLPT